MVPSSVVALVTSLSLGLLASPALGAEPSHPGADRRTTVTRPLSILLEDGFGGPTGIFGASVGYHVTPEIELAVGGGLGFTGIQAALLGRYAIQLGDSPTMAWLVGFGPSLAFRSEALGFHIERADDTTVISRQHVYYTAWLNAETGWVGRARWGGILRVVIGVELRVADNQRHLCDGAAEGDAGSSDCNPMHFGPGSAFAKHLVLPYLALAFGWAF